MSIVYRVITKKRLTVGLPLDYAILMVVVLGTLYMIMWYSLRLPNILQGWHIYLFLGIVAMIMWGFGFIKASVDAEFLGVHVAKFKIPAKNIKQRIDRYLNKINLEP